VGRGNFGISVSPPRFTLLTLAVRQYIFFVGQRPPPLKKGEAEGEAKGEAKGKRQKAKGAAICRQKALNPLER